MKIDIEKFNPKGTLSDEAKSMLRGFGKEEISHLAAAYPNGARSGAYLTLYDKNVAADKQTFPLSTFQNLATLYRLGKTNYVAWDFRNSTRRLQPAVANKNTKKIVDLSAADIQNAPGLKKQTEPSEDSSATETEAAAVTPESRSDEYLAAKKAYDEALERKAHPNTLRALEAKLKKIEN